MKENNPTKRVLIIAPLSFPVTGPEEIVNINLLKVLTQSGEFEIDLISRRTVGRFYPSAVLESYGVRLNRIDIVKDGPYIGIQKVLFLLQSFFRFRTLIGGRGWSLRVLRLVEKKIKVNEYDYVLTKSSPSLFLGWFLKKKYGIKWIASWNDPCPRSKYPPPYGKGADNKGSLFDRLTVKRMRCADFHIFPCDRLSRYMQSYLAIAEDKCVTVAHASSFHKVFIRKTPGDTLRMLYSGNLLPPRDPKPLLQALASIHKESPQFEISLTLVGSLLPSTNDLIRAYDLEECVKVLPPVEYLRSLEMMVDYDVAIIVEAPVEEGIFLPTKVGDYVNMGIPVFAISPDVGTLNDLYKNKVIGYFASIRNPESITEEIRTIYEDFIRKDLKRCCGEIPYSNPSYIVEQYRKF